MILGVFFFFFDFKVKIPHTRLSDGLRIELESGKELLKKKSDSVNKCRISS